MRLLRRFAGHLDARVSERASELDELRLQLARRVEGGADADAETCGVCAELGELFSKLVVLRRSAQSLEKRGTVGPVPRLTGDVDVSRTHDVPHAHLEWIDPEVARDQIDVRFGGERVLRLPGRTRMS